MWMPAEHEVRKPFGVASVQTVSFGPTIEGGSMHPTVAGLFCHFLKVAGLFLHRDGVRFISAFCPRKNRAIQSDTLR